MIYDGNDLMNEAREEYELCVNHPQSYQHKVDSLSDLFRLRGQDLGADDFDAITAEKYGWVNRALPDAELDSFVDNFARRIASFEKRPLELAKKLVNARAGIPSEAERWSSNQSFVATTTWPETQAVIGQILQNGIQQKGDFELRMGHHLGHLRRKNETNLGSYSTSLLVNSKYYLPL